MAASGLPAHRGVEAARSGVAARWKGMAMADTSSIHHEMFDCLRRRDLGALRELYHRDYRYEGSDGTTGGADVGIAVAETYLSAFPDLELEIRHETPCGEDLSVIEFRATGTHQGPLEGIAPTGRRIEADVCNIIEVRAGKIAVEREYYDSLSMLRQLGVAEAAPAASAASLSVKSFDRADETRRPTKTTVEVVDLTASKAARLTLEPGWRWSECIQPVAGGDACMARHVGTIVAGRLHVEHRDGATADLGPGDAYVIEPGHDAWVVGDERVVGFEFESASAATYAR